MPSSLITDLLPENAKHPPGVGCDPRIQLKGMYRTMVLIRRVEESLLQMAESGKIGGAMHTAIGHEAKCDWRGQLRSSRDFLTCTYRGTPSCPGPGYGSQGSYRRGPGPRDRVCERQGGSCTSSNPNWADGCQRHVGRAGNLRLPAWPWPASCARTDVLPLPSLARGHLPGR